MPFYSKKSIPRKAFLFISITFIGITLGALLILSASINKNNEDTYRYITVKNFHQKYRELYRELEQIEAHQEVLDRLFSNASQPDLHLVLQTLNRTQSKTALPKNNWFFESTSENTLSQYNWGTPNIEVTPTFISSIETAENKDLKYTFIQEGKTLYWILFNTLKTDQDTKRYYGFTLNMQQVHLYLTTLDINTPNYAYIFNRDGTCLFHPEVEMIGKNVFDFSSVNPVDTLSVGELKNPPVVLSEYLNIEVFRFLEHFQSAHLNGFISINFPKINVDDNIKPIKNNTYWILITTIILLAFIFYLFNRATKKAYLEKEILAVENEKFHKEKAMVELDQLKKQINPHFLFNSLNSLYMLIKVNTEDAQQFALNLSKTYRYFIHPPTENSVLLSEELNFIKEYLSLQKIRFGSALGYKIDDFEPVALGYKIPYLALQIVVENALKHNIATTDAPLHIHISFTNNSVLVLNNLQKRNRVYGEGNFGLNYLKTIYAFYGITSFKTEEKEGFYICKLPLILE